VVKEDPRHGGETTADEAGRARRVDKKKLPKIVKAVEKLVFGTGGATKDADLAERLLNGAIWIARRIAAVERAGWMNVESIREWMPQHNYEEMDFGLVGAAYEYLDERAEHKPIFPPSDTVIERLWDVEATPRSDPGSKFHLQVRQIGQDAELDEPDPPVDSLNREAWDELQQTVGGLVTLTVSQGRPALVTHAGELIPAKVTFCGCQSRTADDDPARLLTVFMLAELSGRSVVEAFNLEERLVRVKRLAASSPSRPSAGEPPEIPRDPAELPPIPTLDRNSPDWVRNREAARKEGIQTRTLAQYRHEGQVAPDGMSGIDPEGRMWRRAGTKTSHPWYYKPSLVSSRNS
jgi:hypothetical protein